MTDLAVGILGGLFAPRFAADYYDRLAREQEIARHFESIIDLDVGRGRTFPLDAERRQYVQAFRDFQSWTDEHGVSSLPATGYTAAMYLLDLAAYGEPLGNIECAADAITFTHDIAEQYLDRTPIEAALLAGFGRAAAEVGAIIIVGGNIEGFTRTMTTAIALETSKGDLPLAVGLGLVLIVIVVLINVFAWTVRRAGERLAR
jgi:hypothetical protein